MLHALAIRSPSAPGQVPPRDEGEEARVAVPACERQHVALEAFQDLLERLRLLRRRAGEALPHLGRRGALIGGDSRSSHSTSRSTVR